MGIATWLIVASLVLLVHATLCAIQRAYPGFFFSSHFPGIHVARKHRRTLSQIATGSRRSR